MHSTLLVSVVIITHHETHYIRHLNYYETLDFERGLSLRSLGEKKKKKKREEVLNASIQ